MSEKSSVILENEKFRLVLSSDCRAHSLVLKSNGEECICSEESQPFFSITQERPYNNEIKLAHPCKQTTFGSDRVRYENGKLIVGFELIKFEAVVDVKISPRYIVFTLEDFIVPEDAFGIGVLPILPPVYEFRMAQIPVVKRQHFGEWLNVVFDDSVAVNVLGACPYPIIGSEERRDCKILYGETLRDVRLKNVGVALIVSETNELLDAIDSLEIDYNLPRGAESRRSPLINRSYYWTGDLTPKNVDEHIMYAKKGGFSFMNVYYTSVFPSLPTFRSTNKYDVFRDEYPNGYKDVEAMLKKIKDAGITPGLHVLHSHIGLASKYMTPVADSRVNLTRRFTLSKNASCDDTTLFVNENPEGSPVFEKLRVLRFMGELISYESFTTERPYCFTGCKRGFNETVSRDLEAGTCGGVVDISEFCGDSAYIDQNTDLQDEIAEDIAKLYDCGFEFMYFDGAEGTNPPFDINVGLAQWRVYEKLATKPIFCEGAAKSHFSWHMLSGGNAFDVWPPDSFKQMIAEHPASEAPRMANDFTRLNFGWWVLRSGQRADIFEYGTSKAAAWDCPGSFTAPLDVLATVPRSDDILETLRRWELARESGFITRDIKNKLRDTSKEYTLLVDENGCLELAEWEKAKLDLIPDEIITAFVFERRGLACCALWSNRGNDKVSLDIGDAKISYISDFGGDKTATESVDGRIVIPADSKKYLVTDLSKEELMKRLCDARLETI